MSVPCKYRMTEYMKERRAIMPRSYFREIERKHQYRVRYGITIAQYDEMLLKQKNCCAICNIHQSKIKTRLAVDHCHMTGKVRGLLCPTCNKNLGILENKEFCSKASIYLGGY